MSANLLGEGVKIVRQQSPTCCFLVHGFELQPHPPKFLGVLLSVCLSVYGTLKIIHSLKISLTNMSNQVDLVLAPQTLWEGAEQQRGTR